VDQPFFEPVNIIQLSPQNSAKLHKTTVTLYIYTLDYMHVNIQTSRNKQTNKRHYLIIRETPDTVRRQTLIGQLYHWKLKF
jgi:hypothetical protein